MDSCLSQQAHKENVKLFASAWTCSKQKPSQKPILKGIQEAPVMAINQIT